MPPTANILADERQGDSLHLNTYFLHQVLMTTLSKEINTVPARSRHQRAKLPTSTRSLLPTPGSGCNWWEEG